MNEVYTRFFPDSGIARAVAYMPARTVVEVAELPMHALVQIEAVVVARRRHPPAGSGGPSRPDHRGQRHGRCSGELTPPQSVAFSHYNNISGAAYAGTPRQRASSCRWRRCRAG